MCLFYKFVCLVVAFTLIVSFLWRLLIGCIYDERGRPGMNGDDDETGA